MRSGIVLVACLLGGCLETNTIVCGDGRICPSGRACDLVHGACVLPEQLESCVG